VLEDGVHFVQKPFFKAELGRRIHQILHAP
jgi:hypothetical protein